MEQTNPTVVTLSDGIAVVKLGRDGPVLLDAVLRAALFEAVGSLAAREDVSAILLHGAGGRFSAGEPDPMPGIAEVAPTLADLCQRVENCAKPVIAVLQGGAAGAGAELALACHYRVSTPTAWLSFPLVRLGLPPRAGSTQRLPRLVGAAAALEILLSGRPYGPDDEVLDPLIDAVTPSDEGVLGAATTFAASLVAEKLGRRPTRDSRQGFADPGAYRAATAGVAAALKAGASLASREILRAVEAAPLLPFAAGLTLEADAFQRCHADPQATALRYLDQATTRAMEQLQGSAEAPMRIGLVHGGAYAQGTAAALLAAGQSVLVIEPDESGLDALEAQVRDALDQAVIARRLSVEDRADRLSHLDGDTDTAALSEVDLILDLGTGRGAAADRLAALQSVRAPDALLATSRRGTLPDMALGLRFPTGPGAEALAEIVQPRGAAPEAAARLCRLAARMNRVPVRGHGGWISAWLQSAWFAAVDDLILAGIEPQRIEAAFRSAGFASGPCALRDAIGLRASLDQQPIGAGHDTGLASALAATGHGYLTSPPPDWATFCLGIARDTAPLPAPRSDAGILRHGHLALVQAGLRLMRSGTAARPSDIDLIAVHLLGYPRWQGGPMVQAGFSGLAGIRRDLVALSERDPGRWALDPLLDDLIKNGRGFEDLG